MTVVACPHGCGGYVDTSADAWCPSCRRDPRLTEIEPPGSCWAWWGPADHRMRCRKRAGHGGTHSTHDDCGETRADGLVCGKADGHDGPHWAKERREAGQS